MKNKGWLMIVCLLLSLLFVCPALAQETALPQVGQEISGFVVQSLTPMDVLGATGVLFEHTKSGAQLLWLASEDTNRSFDITFRTPALDDTGKAHVFEHMTICGSEKYPDPNMFFSFYNQTYSTFVNAATYHGMTSYPVASLSEEQLLTMMDYYLSGVFHPLVYTEPRMVQREAWRYELADADAPITLAGTVYSEMQGATTIERSAGNNNLATAFEGGAASYVSGGTVEAIPTLTQEALITFHDTYYLPSNALIVLYGALDISRYLAAIDGEYLSQYEKTDVTVEMGRVEPYVETRYATYDYPVEADAQTENASCIYYSFVADQADMKEYFRLSVLSGVLGQEASPLMVALREALPQAQISLGMNPDAPSPMLMFTASGVNEEDRDLFVKTVDESLAQIAAQGFSQDEVDAVMGAEKRSLLLTGEDQDLGVNASMQIAMGWNYFGSTDLYVAYENAVNEAMPDTLMDTLNRWTLGNAYRAVSVTRPVAGLAEEKTAALEKTLADLKAGMTQEEIAQMVQDSADFTQWSSTPADPEVIEPILNITPENLPEELVHYDVTDETTEGVRYLTSVAPVSGIANVGLRLDGSTIPVEQLQDVETYLEMVGQLPTAQYSREELDSQITRYMGDFGCWLEASVNVTDPSQATYYANISYKVLTEDVPTAAALLSEMLLNSDLSDTDTIRQLLSRDVTSFAQTLDSNVLSLQMSRLSATLNAPFAYQAYLNGFERNTYDQELLELDDETLTARLAAARDLLLDRRNAVVTCAGDEQTIASACGQMGALLATLPDVERTPVDYTVLMKTIGWEAVTCNSTVQMNLVMQAPDSFTGRDAVISSLIDDQYLLPQLRNVYGAYGAYSSFNSLYSMLYTYRDPNLAQTFELFAQLPEFMRTADITQDMVDSYIVGCYTSYARPQGALSGAISAIGSVFDGQTEALRLQRMQEIKQTTVEDVRAKADDIQKLVETGSRSTSATSSTIEANKELFTEVVRLGGE